MYYELYIDVLFLVNFMMDYLVLLITRRILKCTATHVNICLGALAGSFATCLIVCLPIPYAVVKFVLFHVVINVFMVKVGLKIKGIRPLIRALTLLYISAFLLGGIATCLKQYMRTGSLFFAMMVVSYYLVQGVWTVIGYVQKIKSYECKVTMYVKEREHTVNAVIDTGNRLRDPVTDRPVSILEKGDANILFGKELPGGIRYIPYHTIGKQEGVMPIFQIEKMRVDQERQYWIERPVIGISEEEISGDGDYTMILNPEIL